MREMPFVLPQEKISMISVSLVISLKTCLFSYSLLASELLAIQVEILDPGYLNPRKI